MYMDSVGGAGYDQNLSVIQDPQAEKFRITLENKIKEFRTLKQLDQTLCKQTPRITLRGEKPSTFDEHTTVKRLAMQVK